MSFPKVKATPFIRKALKLRETQIVSQNDEEDPEWNHKLKELEQEIYREAMNAEALISGEVISASFDDDSKLRIWFDRDILRVSLNGKERKGNCRR